MNISLELAQIKRIHPVCVRRTVLCSSLHCERVAMDTAYCIRCTASLSSVTTADGAFLGRTPSQRNRFESKRLAVRFTCPPQACSLFPSPSTSTVWNEKTKGRTRIPATFVCPCSRRFKVTLAYQKWSCILQRTAFPTLGVPRSDIIKVLQPSPP